MGRREEAWDEKRLENITRRQEIRGCHTPAFPVGAASGQALCTSASGFTPSEAEEDPGTHHRGCRLFLRRVSLYGLEHIHDSHHWNF